MLAPCDVGRRLVHPAPGWHNPCTWPGTTTVRVHLQGHQAVVWLCDHHLAGVPTLDGDPDLLPPPGTTWATLDGLAGPGSATGQPDGPPGPQGGPGGLPGGHPG